MKMMKMLKTRSYEPGTKAVEMVKMMKRMRTKAGLRSYEPGTMSVSARGGAASCHSSDLQR